MRCGKTYPASQLPGLAGSKSFKSDPPEFLIQGHLQSLWSGNIRTDPRYGIIVLFVGLMIAKVIASMQLNLFGDEVFYFQCAQRLDMCYADHPFITALLVRLGTIVAGDTTFGVRLMFLVVGLGIPLGVFWLARPLVGQRDAWLAMAASLLMPPLGLISTVAVPDVPLLACVALGLVAFERATRIGGNLRWLAAGLMAALGLSTHYRFTPFLFAAFLYLAGTDYGRSCLKKPGPWIGFAATCIGFLPSLLFNSQLNWAPIRFQFMDRHNGVFQLKTILMYPLEQFAIVSPFLYVALLIILVVLWRRARGGDNRCALLAVFSSSFLGVYFFMGPWADMSHDHIHWPLPGYLPLFVFLPAMLRSFVELKPTVLRKRMTLLVPGLGAVLIFVVLLDVSLGLFEFRFLHGPFVGWNKGGKEARMHLQDVRDLLGDPGIVVADNYILAGQCEFYLPDGIEVYSLDHRRNQKHGRGLQYKIWNVGEDGLREHAGENALVIIEETATKWRNRKQWKMHIESFFEFLEPVGRLEFPLGKKRKRRFLYYFGQNILSESTGDSVANSYQSQVTHLNNYFKKNEHI